MLGPGEFGDVGPGLADFCCIHGSESPQAGNSLSAGCRESLSMSKQFIDGHSYLDETPKDVFLGLLF